MFGSVRLGTILGIPVGVNWSVLLVAGLIAFSLAGQLLPTQVPGLEPLLYWAAGAMVAGLFFASLLAHELSHAIVARREGIAVSGITLWLLGGVARMKGDAATPGAEARIAGVGPLTSFALALAFGAATIGLSALPASDLTALLTASAAWLSLVNLVLAVFNLLPGAPLDGGRIARALFWRIRGDKMQATRWSTGLGQFLGYGLIGIGLLRSFSGDLGGIWFVILGFFLNGAAGMERRTAELLDSVRGLRVRDVMTREPLRVPAGLTVETFATAEQAEPRTSAWLVTGPGGHILGLLDLDALRALNSDERERMRVGDLAAPLDDWPVVTPDEPVLGLLERAEGGSIRALVRDPDEATGFSGLLVTEDILRAAAAKQQDRSADRETPSPDDDASERGVVP